MTQPRFYALFAWRSGQFLDPMTASEMAESLSVENLPDIEIPMLFYEDVVSFRHLRKDARVAAASRYYLYCQRGDPR